MTLILATIVAAIAIGLLAGGRPRFFPSVPLRWWLLAIGGVALQVLPLNDGIAFWALTASLAMLVSFAIVNIRAPGFILILTGLLLNGLVILANHGMPVTQRALERSGQASTLADLIANGGAKHHLADDGTILLPLADVIAIGKPVAQVVSVGDLCVHLGVAWFIVVALQPRDRVHGPSRSGSSSP